MKTYLISFFTVIFGNLIFKNDSNVIVNLENIHFDITQNDIDEDIFYNQS